MRRKCASRGRPVHALAAISTSGYCVIALPSPLVVLWQIARLLLASYGGTSPQATSQTLLLAHVSAVALAPTCGRLIAQEHIPSLLIKCGDRQSEGGQFGARPIYVAVETPFL